MSPGVALLDALSRVGCGGLLLGASGSVLQFNSVAERCLERHTNVQGVRDNGWATRALLEILGNEACFAGLTTPAVVWNAIKRPIIAQSVSLPGTDGRHPKTMLMLLDLAEHPRLGPDMLAQVFGLTRSEARLAVRLACGDCLNEIAEAYGISVATTREQLKAIFAKTDTSRQGEFVALANHLALISCLSELMPILAVGQAGGA